MIVEERPTPLALRLAARIARDGAITIADYMEACLGDPAHGYYMTRDPFGVAGDFITAPEISQMFGELIGLWAVETWDRLGRPAPFLLAELGPGRGTLMADALRATRLVPEFEAAAQIVLVETSPRLAAIQRSSLADHSIRWTRSIEELPGGPAIILANEFFDALPVRQFVRLAAGWAERRVTTTEGAFAYQLCPAPDFAGPTGVEEGTIVEIASAAEAIIETLAARVAKCGGVLLAIDYGHDGAGYGETLQAVRQHQPVSPLAFAGEADLTVHVDFARLAAAVRASGAEALPLMTQGEFLLALGLLDRAGRLGAGKDASAQAAIAAAVERLAGQEAMGHLFKVLCVTTPGLALPPFPSRSGVPAR